MTNRYKSARIEPKGATIKEEFEALMAWMDRDAGHSSRIKDRLEHPAFAEIVSHGREVLPLVLDREMSWVEMELICQILGSRPPEIPENCRGRVDKLRKIYKKWLCSLDF